VQSFPHQVDDTGRRGPLANRLHEALDLAPVDTTSHALEYDAVPALTCLSRPFLAQPLTPSPIVRHNIGMPPLQAAVLFVAAMLGGAINSVAGGGSFIAFPALLMYNPGLPIESNATNTVALWPGSVASAGAYRTELQAQRHVLVLMSIVSLIGGYIGARILVGTRPRTFEHLLPWLLLVATLLFTFGGEVAKKLRARTKHVEAPSWAGTAGVAALQFCIAIYGGFFGGGIGILMLATLALMGMEDIHTMNALKTVLGSLINGIAVFAFILAGKVMWPQAPVMVVGAVVGGYFGAFYAKKLPPATVRAFVIAVGFAMTAWFFAKYGL
jgi:uncharacterized membrane protein YfcA